MIKKLICKIFGHNKDKLKNTGWDKWYVYYRCSRCNYEHTIYDEGKHKLWTDKLAYLLGGAFFIAYISIIIWGILK